MSMSNDGQKVWLAIVPRICGIISLSSSVCMLYMAWNSRKLLFHRLVFGMAFYLVIMSICMVVGTAAAPKDDTNIDRQNNIGTVLTCTIQGFLHYVSTYAALFYYCSFSVYSCTCVLTNFDKWKYLYIEKYIHICVHIWPFITGFYLLSIQGFNSSNFPTCEVSSDPLFCGGDPDPISNPDYVKCKRGPENANRLLQLVFVIPQILVLGIATVVMVTLYCSVTKRQNNYHKQCRAREEEQKVEEEDEERRLPQEEQINEHTTAIATVTSSVVVTNIPSSTTTIIPFIRIDSNIVLKQAAIYLFALYWVILPFFIYNIMQVRGTAASEKNILITYADINLLLFGLWSMLTYCYFTIDKNRNKCWKIICYCCWYEKKETKKNDNDSNIKKSDRYGGSEIVTSPTGTPSTHAESIFCSDRDELDDGSGDDGSGGVVRDATTTLKDGEDAISTIEQQQQRQQPRAYSFNIFDGTNAGGAFSDFVYDGNSQDEKESQAEDKYWKDVQDHI